MSAPIEDQSPPQRGLLDLSVDLSVPEVYSGSDFTVYLHIKNPFEVPVWVGSVELSLPTQLEWRSPETGTERSSTRSAQWEEEVLRGIRQRDDTIVKLREEMRNLPDDDRSNDRRSRITAEIWDLSRELERERDSLQHGNIANVSARDEANIRYYGPLRELNVTAEGKSTVSVHFQPDEPERVPLTGSLPRGTALEPGCTDVWTIRLGTGRNLLFLPAKYHLQLTVIYQTQPPTGDNEPREGNGSPVPRPRTYSNTTSFTIALKAALWKVMVGGSSGGCAGSVARTLQETQAGMQLASWHTLSTLLLAVLLSGAAIIFAARKSDAQSFVTVEDFWGGLLVGFLIGYSGTAAFSDITGIK